MLNKKGSERDWRCPVTSWVLLCAKSLTFSLLFLTSPLPGCARVLFRMWPSCHMGHFIICLISSRLFQAFQSVWFGLTVKTHFQHLLIDVWTLYPPPSHTHSLETENSTWSKQTKRVVDGAEPQLGEEVHSEIAALSSAVFLHTLVWDTDPVSNMLSVFSHRTTVHFLISTVRFFQSDHSLPEHE